MKTCYKFKTAFTLAEVLITLLIIGVVSSIVIPSVLNDTQDAELKTAWKKQYGVLSQTTLQVLSDNGGSFKGITNSFNPNYLRDQYLQYLSSIKKCNSGGQWAGTCWNAHIVPNGIGVTKYLNRNDIYANYIPFGNGNAGAVLNDGTFILFAYQDSTCSTNDWVFTTATEGLTNLCGWMTVDINGAKGPNIVGKDVFGVWIKENGIVPYGVKDLSGTCNTSASGLGCSAKYLYQ